MSDVRILPVSSKITTAHARKHTGPDKARAWCPLCVTPAAAPVQTAPKGAKPPVKGEIVHVSAQAPEVVIPAEVRDAAAVLAGFARKYDVRLTHEIVRALAQAQTVGVPTPAPARKAPARKATPTAANGTFVSKNGFPLKGAALANAQAKAQGQAPVYGVQAPKSGKPVVWIAGMPVPVAA
jgi:hypothetical protein